MRETIFKLYHETSGNSAEYFRLAQGGIYEIKRLGMPSLYFTVPWNVSFWYVVGPDMRIVSNKTFNTSCDVLGENGNITYTGISPEYNNYGVNNFAIEETEGSITPNFSSFVFNENRNIVSSTNLEEMYDFWVDEPKFWISFGPFSLHEPSRGIRRQIDLNDMSVPIDTSTLTPPIEQINSNNYRGNIENSEYNNLIDPDTKLINLLVELELSWTNNSVTTHYEEISFDTENADNLGGREISLFFTSSKFRSYKVKIYGL